LELDEVIRVRVALRKEGGCYGSGAKARQSLDDLRHCELCKRGCSRPMSFHPTSLLEPPEPVAGELISGDKYTPSSGPRTNHGAKFGLNGLVEKSTRTQLSIVS